MRPRAPDFSIILPTYDRAHVLGDAIQSVLDQVHRSWELIIVDDGSRDRTPELARAFCAQDPRIRYVRQSNAGPAAARNTGITVARGALLAFIDSDDRYLPHHLETRHREFTRDPQLDLIHGRAVILGDPWIADRADPARRVNLEELPIGGTFTLRTELARRLGGFPNARYSEDSLLLEAAIRAGARVAHLGERTYVYDRRSADSICTALLRAGAPR
jgi:glycosyltransferase involved in cell wall biosynthesis